MKLFLGNVKYDDFDLCFIGYEQIGAGATLWLVDQCD